MEDDISNLTWDDAAENKNTQPANKKVEAPNVASEKKEPPAPEQPKVKSPVKSYYSDMESAARGESGKSMSKVLEEARAAETRVREVRKQKKRNIVYVGLSVLLLLLAVAVVGFFVLKKNTPTVQLQQETAVVSLLPSDEQIYIDISGASSFKIASLVKDTLAEQREKNQQITLLSFIENKSLGFSFTTLPTLLAALKIEPPLSLTQVLTQNFMYGTYTDNQAVHPFLVLELSSFNGAFQGMRGWEKNMLDDLHGIFQFEEERLTPEAFASTFEDVILENKNVRMLSIPTIIEREEIVLVSPVAKNFIDLFEDQVSDEPVGAESIEEPAEQEPVYTTQTVEVLGPPEPVLMYMFLDEETVLITTHRDVLFEVLDRLAKQQIFE